MAFTVAQLVDILQLFFTRGYPARSALLALGTLGALLPLLDLDRMQHLRARQPARTAWIDSIYTAFKTILPRSALPEPDFSTRHEDRAVMHKLSDDLADLGQVMELEGDDPAPLLSHPSVLLCTSRRVCAFCPDDGPHAPYILYRHEPPQRVKVVLPSFERRVAVLLSAYCRHCEAHYYPDRITLRNPANARQRLIRLEADPPFVRISKPDKLWASRDLMILQSSAFRNFYCGWSSFSKFVKQSAAVPSTETLLNERQTKRMFAEHFGRRLLTAHGHLDAFRCRMDPDVDDFMLAIIDTIGNGKGFAPRAFEHRCVECTHKKVTPQPVAAGNPAQQPPHHAVLGVEAQPVLNLPPVALPQVQPPVPVPNNGQELLINMAVIDGKVIQHWICAVPNCPRPLDNYKNGRFCKPHLELAQQCAISFCQQPVANGTPVCAMESHANWYRNYAGRFGRLSYQGVRRVVRQQLNDAERGNDGVQNRVHLPDIDGIPGNQVPHTLRPRSVHCIQTAQWACGYPIAWTKFYDSESLTQVYTFLSWIWPNPLTRPTYISYDNACKLLRHIVTQHFGDQWIQVTRFLVDTWHYINHVADDDVCRVWCNPVPMDGSQPDLVLEKRDINGNLHQTRAFNMETAEQFNSWLDRYKGLLEQMTATSHDFVMHTLFMLYGEMVEERIALAARKRAERRRRQREGNDGGPGGDGDDDDVEEE